jgi:cytoskeletal protein RodZ
MRTCIGISVAIHAAILLWLVLAPGARTFGPANAEAIQVDLVPPQDAREPQQETQHETQQETRSEATKSEPVKSEPSELPRTAPRKPAPFKPDPKGSSKTAADDSAEERAATAARLAWLLNLPSETEASLAGPPSESKSPRSRRRWASAGSCRPACRARPVSMS